MTESTTEFEGFPPEPGTFDDPSHGYTSEEVPEVKGHEESPENDKELGDAEEQETED